MGHRNTLGTLGLLGILVAGALVAGCDDQPAPPPMQPEQPGTTTPPPATSPVVTETPAGSDPAATDATPPAGQGTGTLLGMWIMNRSQGGAGVAPGPAAIFEIMPTRIRITDRFMARDVIMTYRDIGDSKIEVIGGLDGLFTEPDGSPGIWGYIFEVDGTLTLWQPTRVYGFRRDHPIVRERTGGYAFTEEDQTLRFEANDRLRNLSNAVFRYGARHGGKLPESLDALVESGLVQRSGDTPLASPLGPAGDGGGDYWLSPAIKLRGKEEPRVILAQVEFPEKEIMIYDRTSVLRGKGVHAVFFDGHIELLDDESFLAAQRHAAHAGVDLRIPKR
ncbi:MAG: hypothetical protein ACYTGP_04755 [Planctomycetota bacterium]